MPKNHETGHVATIRHYGPNETGFVEFRFRMLTQRIFNRQNTDFFSL